MGEVHAPATPRLSRAGSQRGRGGQGAVGGMSGDMTAQGLVMVEPDTVVRWHRSAWRAYWRWKSRRGPGRAHIPAERQRLILRIATENPRWGAVRIVGELRALGFT